VRKDFLLAERDEAYKAELTLDCREKCAGCGVCGTLDSGKIPRGRGDTHHPLPVTHYSSAVTSHPSSVTKIRFRFAKREAVKFISHLDLLNTLTRAFRRAEIPMAYSQGFNPHPKISFGSTLPVGTTSEAEFADIALETYMEPDDFISRSNDELPSGLEFLEAQEIPIGVPSLMASSMFMASPIPG
jgi:hypothetical protein